MKKVLIDRKGNKYYWKEKDLHTHKGMIKEADIKKKKKVRSNLNAEFYVLDADFQDKITKMKRGPAIMLRKDIGLILTYNNVNKNSIVLDAGSGSGMLTMFLSRFCKKVYGYEKDKRFCKIVDKNLKDLNIKNVVLKNKDVYKKIDEKNLDLITLDLEEPWKALKNSEKALKKGAYFVVYLPNITQVTYFLKQLKKHEFVYLKTIELIERNWLIDDRRARPESMIIGHTGFLIFTRKL